MPNLVGYLLSSNTGYLRPVLIIILFFVVLYGGYYFSTRMRTGGIKNFKSGGLKVIQGLFIGPNQSLQLVKIYDRYVVLGVCKDRISLIMELSEEEITEHGDGEDFTSVLSRFAISKKQGDDD